jgi:hypothetical protein
MHGQLQINFNSVPILQTMSVTSLTACMVLIDSQSVMDNGRFGFHCNANSILDTMTIVELTNSIS